MILYSTFEKPLSVSHLSTSLSQIVQEIDNIWVEGQISQLTERRYTSSYGRGSIVYITLRDTLKEVSINIAYFGRLLDMQIADGDRVIVYGKLNIYQKNTSLSMRALEIRKVGIGELLVKLERLRKKLEGEGLFAEENKKKLPFIPNKIGIICGYNAAAKWDVINNIDRRWPGIIFETLEVSVQNTKSPGEIIKALDKLEHDIDNVDVIIITRGGGSFEDLLPFYDVDLLYRVFKCTIPIVSAIGHEQDNPFLDFVADYRASTPTDAAKNVVPSFYEEYQNVIEIKKQVDKIILYKINSALHDLSSLFNIYNSSISFIKQYLDYCYYNIKNISERPIMINPISIFNRKYDNLSESSLKLNLVIDDIFTFQYINYKNTYDHLLYLDPSIPLEKGFTILFNHDKMLLKSRGQLLHYVNKINNNIQLKLLFNDGMVEFTALKDSIKTIDDVDK